MAFLTTFRLINTTFVDQQHLSFRFVVCLKNSEKWLLSICKVLCLFRQKGIQCHKQEEHRRRHRHSTGFEGLEFELKNELPPLLLVEYKKKKIFRLLPLLLASISSRCNFLEPSTKDQIDLRHPPLPKKG